jgi:hypothetical protein
MRINNSELEYFIDYINKRIHLLDLDTLGMRSLTNTIDPTFQKMFIEHENLLKDVIDFQWICYATDGLIAEYKNYNFKFIPNEADICHKPFKEKMLARRKKWNR